MLGTPSSLRPIVTSCGLATALFSLAPGAVGPPASASAQEGVGIRLELGGDVLTSGGPTTASTSMLAAVKDPGFSYVDANNDHLYDEADGDVPLELEIDDGKFDTRKKEGGYTTVIPGAGLVLNDGPTGLKKLKYQCDGDLVVNVSMSAVKQILLRSRSGSVLFDDPTVSAKTLVVKAAEEIASDDDALLGAGPKSKVLFSSGGSILLNDTTVTAGKLVKMTSKTGAILASLTRIRACETGGKVQLAAFGDVNVATSVVRAYSLIDLKAKPGNVVLSDASAAIVDGSARGKFRAKGSVVHLDNATVLAAKEPKIIGTPQGTPAELGIGTLPCVP